MEHCFTEFCVHKKTSGGVAKLWPVGLHLQSFWASRSGWSLRTFISEKLPSDLVLLLGLWHTLWWPQALREREECKGSSWCMFTDALYCWELCKTFTHWTRAFFLFATLLIIQCLCTGYMASPECLLHLSQYRVGLVLSVIDFCDSVLLHF